MSFFAWDSAHRRATRRRPDLERGSCGLRRPDNLATLVRFWSVSILPSMTTMEHGESPPSRTMVVATSAIICGRSSSMFVANWSGRDNFPLFSRGKSFAANASPRRSSFKISCRKADPSDGVDHARGIQCTKGSTVMLLVYGSGLPLVDRRRQLSSQRSNAHQADAQLGTCR